METNSTDNLNCFQRIYALGNGRFLRSEAQYWFFRSVHIQMVSLLSIVSIIILIADGFESSSNIIIALAILTVWTFSMLQKRHYAAYCYAEGYRQGYIDGVVKHWEPLILDIDVQERYLNKRLKEFEACYSKADEEFINMQKEYLLKGQSNAKILFSTSFRKVL